MSLSLHGGNRRAFARKFGIEESRIVDFSTNGNPWGPPESVLQCYRDSFSALTAYPDPESSLLKKEVARHFPLWPENVIVGNGATELIYTVVQFLKPRAALLVEPTFLEYRRALNLFGVEVRSVLLKESSEFRFDLAELLNAARGVDLIVISNPNNPTGGVLAREEALSFIEEMKRRRIFVVVDEAFIDWIPDESLAKQVTDQSYFFLIRSLTKFFNLPGIRIGFGLGSRRLIEHLENTKVTWSVNSLAEALGVAALRDQEFRTGSREKMRVEAAFFFEALRTVSELKVYPSKANFFLLKVRSDMRASDLAAELAKSGVMIRDASNFVGLDNQFFRVAVRDRKDNAFFLEELKRVFQTVHAAR